MKLAEQQMIDERYRLLNRIGSGGMADVWCAEDRMLGRKVALKVLHDRFAQDREFVERFRREASAAAGLQHPNVVGVFDRGEVDGTYYIAMEYVEGPSLKDLIVRGLSISEAVEIVRQVLAAAKFAHERGIVHRDLKPQNVLLDQDGRASVADFGIAKAGVSEITQTGSVMGTAQYLSPEQAQGLAVTPASDIYSIGVMLYEMLTGRVPFEGENAVAIAMKQVSEQPVAPSRLNSQVPPALDAVVLRALAKDPARRFANADQFARALDEAEARPDVALEDTAAYAPVSPPPPAPPPDEADRRRRRRRWMVIGGLALLLAAVAVWALTRPGSAVVPDVIGERQSAAEATLEDAGFDVEVRTVPNPQPEGIVLEQFPVGGGEADEGSTVTITVSGGPGTAEVPEVAGLTVKQAKRQLRAAGFTRFRVVRRFSGSVEAGRVVSSEPAGGVEAATTTVVELTVSQGENLVEVPDVVGDPRAIAQSELERAGFLVNVETQQSEAAEDAVIAQDPGGGSTITKGSQVTIVVSSGPGTATVPGVEGRGRRTAVDILQRQGFDVVIQEEATDDPAEDDVVIDQIPSAGSRVERGSQVTIVVGVFEASPPPPGEGGADGGPGP